MRLTLLKSATLPSPVADFGEHDMVYSIMPHNGDFRSGGVIEEAYDLNCPLHAVVSSGNGSTTHSAMSYVSVDKANVVIEAVKNAEDGGGTIVRLYECHNGRSNVELKFGGKLKEVYECDLLENIESEIRHDDTGFTFEIKPYEIKTFRLVH
jgi:alpha-mannosidase